MPWPSTPPTAAHRAAYADAEPRPFWTQPAEPLPALTDSIEADLCIVGAGFTGLWAALYAKERAPEREVVVLDAETAGFGASGRNGGFCVASLTHGIDNGMARFASEMPVLETLALDNFAGLTSDLESKEIACDFEPTGELLALTDAHQLPWLEEESETLTRFGHEVTVLDQQAMRAQVDSPTYVGGVWDRTGAGILDPGKLALGLRDAAIIRRSADLRALGGPSHRRRGADRAWPCPRPQGAAGDECLPAAAEAHRPLHRAGL